MAKRKNSSNSNKEEQSSTAGRIVNSYKLSGNQSGNSSKKLEIVLSEDPSIPLMGIYTKEAPQYHKDMCFTTFIAALYL